MTTPVLTPPPPPAAAPPPLSPRGRTAVRVTLVVAAALLTVGCIVGLAVTSWGVSTLRVTADERPLPAGLKSLAIDIGDVPAALRITTDREAGAPRVKMRLLGSSQSRDHGLVVTDDGGTTRLTVDDTRSPVVNWDGSPLGAWDSASEVNVILPPNLARTMSVTIHQNRGIVFTQADLGDLAINGTNGDVVLGGGARRVDVHTQNGDVSVHDAVSVTESFAVTTAHGDVAVDFKDAAPPTIEATSTSGDIAISVPPTGPYLVNAAGNSTSVRVPQTNDAARAAATVTARSANGDVVVGTYQRG